MIEDAIQSVLSQSDNDYEIIVVDGGSTDKTVEILKKYDKQIAWWVSEADNGQSDAFNKGLAKARGEVVTWLNADDLMLPGTVATIKGIFRADDSIDWVGANMVCFDSDSMKVSRVFFGPRFFPKFMQGANKRICVYGPSSFWKRSLSDAIGLFNEDLRYVMDYEYWARMVTAGIKLHRTNHYCWGFRLHSRSKTTSLFLNNQTPLTQRKIDEEWSFIYNTIGYKPTRFWKLMFLLLRIVDGSYIQALINARKYVGKPVKTCFMEDAIRR